MAIKTRKVCITSAIGGAVGTKIFKMSIQKESGGFWKETVRIDLEFDVTFSVRITA